MVYNFAICIKQCKPSILALKLVLEDHIRGPKMPKMYQTSTLDWTPNLIKTTRKLQNYKSIKLDGSKYIAIWEFERSDCLRAFTSKSQEWESS